MVLRSDWQFLVPQGFQEVLHHSSHYLILLISLSLSYFLICFSKCSADLGENREFIIWFKFKLGDGKNIFLRHYHRHLASPLIPKYGFKVVYDTISNFPAKVDTVQPRELREKSHVMDWGKLLWFNWSYPSNAFIGWLAIENRLTTRDYKAKWSYILGGFVGP